MFNDLAFLVEFTSSECQGVKFFQVEAERLYRVEGWTNVSQIDFAHRLRNCGAMMTHVFHILMFLCIFIVLLKRSTDVRPFSMIGDIPLGIIQVWKMFE
jgi:hypothetical protein